MKSDKWEKYEKKKLEITEHFKKEKRKANYDQTIITWFLRDLNMYSL